MNESFEDYANALEYFCNSLSEQYPSYPIICVFPEYCWRLSPVEKVLNYVNELKNKIRSDLILNLGSIEFVYENKYTNNSILIYENKVIYVPKTKILKSEKDRDLVPGINPGVVEMKNIGDLKIAVLICADLWEPSLLLSLAKQSVDIILVPCWTSVVIGREEIARTSWYSLSRTVSTQYGVVVAVADHAKSPSETHGIGNVTTIFSPDKRQKMFPNSYLTNKIVKQDVEIISLDSIRKERKRWREKGLAPLGL